MQARPEGQLHVAQLPVSGKPAPAAASAQSPRRPEGPARPQRRPVHNKNGHVRCWRFLCVPLSIHELPNETPSRHHSLPTRGQMLAHGRTACTSHCAVRSCQERVKLHIKNLIIISVL